MKLFRYFVIFFCFYTSTAVAQYGFRVKSNFENHGQLNNVLHDLYGGSKNLFSPSYEIGVDYWFALKKKRIEFLPELAFAYGNTDITNDVNVNMQRFLFNFHTQIYALDLNEDCNCPTFSKQGPSINKGFFFHVTPGVSFNQTNSTVTSSDLIEIITEKKSQNLLFHVGLGLGLDLGINDLITLTPMASYYFFSAGSYDIPINQLETTTVNYAFTQLQFQVRAGFRFDYRRSKYGGRRR
jgi:hypothetical protein